MVTEVKFKTLTLHDLVSRFIARRNLSENTREYYRTLLHNFEWYAQSQGWPEPGSITRDHISDFLDYVATESFRWPGAQRSSYKKAAPATVHHYGTVVKVLFNRAEEEEYLDHNPALCLKLGSPRYKEVA